jgi:AraC-like DNA-binding protein
MIIAHLSDRRLLTALRGAAHPEEDVISDPELGADALLLGYPRLIVAAEATADVFPVTGTGTRVPVLELDAATLARWEAERRVRHVPPPRTDFLVERLTGLLERQATEATWVDRTLAELGRAAGAALPPPFRAFARRVFEFPSHYHDLHPMAAACGLTRGALKERFRRRNLPSPYAYIRWLRIMACAQLLADRSVTVARTARRFGYTSAGNLCRTMISLTGLTPTEARTHNGWNHLLIAFARSHLDDEAIAAWRELEELFLRRVA